MATSSVGDAESLLGRLVPGFDGLKPDEFAERYADEVGDLALEVALGARNIKQHPYGRCVATEYVGGLVILTSRSGKSWLFETAARVAEREHIRAWAEFARGHWTRSEPTEPGVYPTRNREGVRGPDRTVLLIDGSLKDMTRGLVIAGRVSNWGGDWWSLPFPPLLGAL